MGLSVAFPELLAKVGPKQLRETIHNLNIELVLTAHPTEVNRRILLRKHNNIARLLALDRATRRTASD